MIKCLICGGMYNSIGIHAKRKHQVSIKDYKEMFPDAPTISEEARAAYQSSGKRRYEAGELSSFREAGLACSRSQENRERLAAHNKDPKFIDSQRGRLSKQMTATNLKSWAENYEDCKVRASRNYVKGLQKKRSSHQLTVGNYLTTSGIDVSYEELFYDDNGKMMLVDIWLPSSNIAIEINGEYGHGDPMKRPMSQWSAYQVDGYNRDLIKINYFGENLLFLWHEDINSGVYKSILKEFLITRGHVKLGELLET